MANLVPMVGLAGLAGRWLDRHDNRRLLIASAATQGVTCVGLALASSTPVVLALMALLGAGQAVTGSAWQALLPVLAGRDRLAAATGLVQAGTTSAGIVAPALAGLLVASAGQAVPLLLDAATFAVVAVAATSVRVTRSGAAGSAKLAGAIGIVRGDDLLRPLFLLLGLFILLASTVNVADVFLVREVLGASTLWYGLAGATFSAGMLVGVLLAGRYATSRLAGALVASTVVLSMGLTANGVVPSVGWLLPAGVLTGVGNGVFSVTLGALVMGRARDAERGRVGALLTGVASGTQLVAFAAGGLLTGALGARTVFVLAGVLGLLAPAVLGRTVIRAASVPTDRPPATVRDHAPAAV